LRGRSGAQAAADAVPGKEAPAIERVDAEVELG
jgi:hypothetical protein